MPVNYERVSRQLINLYDQIPQCRVSDLVMLARLEAVMNEIGDEVPAFTEACAEIKALGGAAYGRDDATPAAASLARAKLRASIYRLDLRAKRQFVSAVRPRQVKIAKGPA
jgi:hypothetical protein